MSPDKPTPDKPTNPVPPVSDKVAPEPTPEPPLEGTLTAEDIAEIEAGGLTLGDVIRELGLDSDAE